LNFFSPNSFILFNVSFTLDVDCSNLENYVFEKTYHVYTFN
jgi:hypothetical protein